MTERPCGHTDPRSCDLDCRVVAIETAGRVNMDLLARALHNMKGGSPRFGVAGECECREDVDAMFDEYDRLRAETGYLARWRRENGY